MAQVELSVLPSCVDLVDANELPVSGIPQHTEQRRYVSNVIQDRRTDKYHALPLPHYAPSSPPHHMRGFHKVTYLLKKLPGPEFLSRMM